MLHQHVSALHAERLRAGPGGPVLDDFTEWLAGRGFRSLPIGDLVRGAVRFAAWADTHGFDSLSPLALAGYETELRGQGRLCGWSTSVDLGGRRLVEFLVARGGVTGAGAPAQRPALLTEFGAWMIAHRGVQPSTVRIYSTVIAGLLSELGDQPQQYHARAIRAFVIERASGHGRATAKAVVTGVRGFLRFLSITGRCNEELLHAVPVIAHWRLDTLPRHIAASEVERLIDSCDTDTIVGVRDRAMLLLLARLALRAGDVAGLRLGDIDWREARVRVAGKNRRAVWLPLPQEVGDAILAYLTRGRPQVVSDRVFVKVTAPIEPLSASVVSQTVSRAIRRTGVEAPSHGAHLLRHSAATAMLRAGATLHEIASVMRHASIETTHRYAKVDRELLDMVAAPWPAAPLPSRRLIDGEMRKLAGAWPLVAKAPAPIARVTEAEVRTLAPPWPEVMSC